MRLRILLGTVILVFGLALYALAASALAPLVPPYRAAQAAFFAIAGVAWLFPAARLTRWMQRAPPFRPPPLD